MAEKAIAWVSSVLGQRPGGGTLKAKFSRCPAKGLQNVLRVQKMVLSQIHYPGFF